MTERPRPPKGWKVKNKRRIDLIEQDTLTHEEQQELEGLQAYADQVIDDVEQLPIGKLEELKNELMRRYDA